MNKFFPDKRVILLLQLIVLVFLSLPLWADFEDMISDESEEFIQPLRQMENLDRGLIAVNLGGSRSSDVYIGWRMLGKDPETIAFNLYRSTGDAEPVKLNDLPIIKSTNYIDYSVNLNQSVSYFVKPVI